MQAHVRHVEKFTNFMSPVGLSLSHYNNTHPRKRQRFASLTNPPNVTGNGTNPGSGSDSEHGASQPVEHSVSRVSSRHHTLIDIDHLPNSQTSTSLKCTENQWTREDLSLRHSRNRSMYYDSDSSHKEAMDAVLDKLVTYGLETSADIAKMQPWQLRVIKREIPQIDYIFMTAYRMWGKQDYYDDHKNIAWRQYWDPAVWLQYNEIELIVKCFDAPQRKYQCMICGTRHGLFELDQVRWHIWLDHKESPQLTAIMEASKKNRDQHNFAKPLRDLQLPPLENSSSLSPNIREKSAPQVISLLDDSSDEEMVKPTRSKKRYHAKGRQYNSRRKQSQQTSPRRRSRRLAHKEPGQLQADKQGSARKKTKPTVQTVHSAHSVQTPIIINGVEDDDVQCIDRFEAYDAPLISGAHPSPFMPSASSATGFGSEPLNHIPLCNNNGNGSAILDSEQRDHNSSAPSASTNSLDTHSMDMDEDFTFGLNGMGNLNGSPGALPMDDSFNMIGFNDDFSTFGVMGALSRNSSGSLKDMNSGLNLKSSFSDNFAL